jgi:NDP-sugar pyrophosphorylase family protein
MMDLSNYFENYYSYLPGLEVYNSPWDAIHNLSQILKKVIPELPEGEYIVENGIAIHNSAIIEKNVTIKEIAIIGEKSIVKAGAYIRGGTFIGKNVNIGANSEIKQSMIFDHSRIAHLNYVGNSIIGEDVNLEAGSILANHFNELKNKNIKLIINESIIETNLVKFGSLIGDGCRIGANSVLNPGTVLRKRSVVGRLVHVDQKKP